MDSDQRVEPVEQLLYEGRLGDIDGCDPLDAVTNGEVVIVHGRSHGWVPEPCVHLRVVLAHAGIISATAPSGIGRSPIVDCEKAADQ